jgi:hypothetical protein
MRPLRKPIPLAGRCWFVPIALASIVRELEKAAQPEPPTREEGIAQRAVAEWAPSSARTALPSKQAPTPY